MFKTARQSSCTCSSKLHQHNCSKSCHRKYSDKDNSPGNSGSHLPGSRGPQEGVRVHASLPEVCCGEDQISGENFLHKTSPPPPLLQPLMRENLTQKYKWKKNSLWFLIKICYLIEKCLICSKNVLWKWAHIFICMIDRAWSMTLTEVLGSTRRRYISKQPSCCSSMLLSNMDPERWVLFTFISQMFITNIWV